VTSADDEGPHAAGAELTWVETTWIEVCDAASGIAGVIRFDARPNQGANEVSLSFFLADDGFVSARHVAPHVVGASGVVAIEDARLETVEPLHRWSVKYDGPSHALASAADTASREAWHKSRLERLIVELDVVATGDAVPGDGSLVQPVRVAGEVWVSGDRYVLDAAGLRGRSWDTGVVPLRASRVALVFDDGSVVFAQARTAAGAADATEIVEGWTSVGGAVRVVRTLRVEHADVAAADVPATLRAEHLDGAAAVPALSIALQDDRGEHRIAAEMTAVAPMPGRVGGRSYELRLGVVRARWKERVGAGFVVQLE
jgi:hypothetical protein